MKSTKKLLSLLLVLAMVFSLAVPVFAEDEATTVSLATWSCASLSSDGENDIVKDVALEFGYVKTTGKDITKQFNTASYNGKNYITAGPWYGAAEFIADTQFSYLTFKVSTKGYENLALNTSLGGNERVPLTYKWEYSLDGEAWVAIDTTVDAIQTRNTSNSPVDTAVNVPVAAEDQDCVYFRLIQTEAAKVKGTSTSNAGALYIYGLALTGTEKATTVDPVDPILPVDPVDPILPVPPIDPTPSENPAKPWTGSSLDPISNEHLADDASLEGKTIILHSNDVHGAIEGYAYITALKAAYEARGAKVIMVDAGDYSQGTTYVSTTKGLDAITMMNAAGYDIASLGNHEFDYGYPQLVSNMEQAEFDVLCADVLDAEGNPIFDANIIKEVGGVKLGFFGLETPEAQTKANPALIKGLTFFAEEELYACAAEQVASLKEQGADIIVCLSHLGVDAESEPNRSYDLYANVSGIDFVIDAHSHTVMEKGDANEHIQSTGTAFSNIGVIVIDNETKAIERNFLVQLKDKDEKGKYTDYFADLEKDETVAAAAQVIIDRVMAEYGEVFAKSEVELNGDRTPGNRSMETNLGDLITDAMLWKTLKDADALSVSAENVVAITNGGGIRAWIHAGDITKNDVNTVLPFGNTLAVVYVKGSELLEALEASTYATPNEVGGFPQVAGMKFTIDTTKAYDKNETTYPGSTYYGPASINRITIDEINGKAFDAGATYAVITNNFLAGGGDTYYAFAAATEQFDTGFPLDEVLMEYITEELNGVVGSEYAYAGDRINIIHEGDCHGGTATCCKGALCEVCGKEYGELDPDNHGGGTEVRNAKDATCTEDGYTGDTYCCGCAVKLADGEVITATGEHTCGTAATCHSKAICSVCGEEYGEFDPENHDDPFTDIEKSAHHDNIIKASELKLVYGYGNGIFAPDDNVTRGQFITMLWRMAGEPKATAELSFTDAASIPDNFKAAIAWGVENKIIFGYSDGSFSYSAPITRGAMAAMMYRYIVNVVDMEITEDMKAPVEFTDDIYEGFKEAVSVMANLGIINGWTVKGELCFGAGNNATRGQTASILYRTWLLVNPELAA